MANELYQALREIKLLLITMPWTERESQIYSVACEAIELVDGEACPERNGQTANDDELNAALKELIILADIFVCWFTIETNMSDVALYQALLRAKNALGG